VSKSFFSAFKKHQNAIKTKQQKKTDMRRLLQKADSVIIEH
jgi:hypothetical protein